MQTVSVENLFARSWELLSRNWVIIVPGLVVAIVAGVLTALLVPQVVVVNDTSVAVLGAFSPVRAMLVAIIGILAAIITISYTTGMAGAAWRTGTTTLADGSEAFKRDAGKVFSAMLALLVVGIVAAVLAPFTLGLSILALVFLFPYTMAAAVIGEHGGFSALSESYRIATKHLVTTIIIVIVAGVIGFCAGLISGILNIAPFIGPIASQILEQIVLAYLTLVLAGVYLAYRDAGVPVAAASPPPPAYEPPPPAPAYEPPPPSPAIEPPPLPPTTP